MHRLSESTRSSIYTFLMTDVVGSAASWDLAPQAMVKALASLLVILESAVTKHGGEVRKLQGEGDSLFAVFVLPHEAIEAAVDIQRAIAEAHWPEGATLRVRVGIHVGPAEVVGDDLVGSGVTQCARIRGFAGPGEIIVSHTAYRLSADRLPQEIALRYIGERKLKGIRVPERLYEAGVRTESDVARARRLHRNRIWADAAISLLIAASLVGLKLWLSGTWVGPATERTAYSLLSGPATVLQSQDQPVVVVNISDLPREPAKSHETIRQLIDKLAQMRPCAIGVDVDFSPDFSSGEPDVDYAYFQQCRSAARGVELRLGVFRSQSMPSALWLGFPEFQSLAANLTLPNDDRMRLWNWTEAGSKTRLYTMSGSLARCYGVARNRLPWWISWAARQEEVRKPDPDHPEFKAGAYLTDYSALKKLDDAKIDYSAVLTDRVQSERIAHNIVLLGDADPTQAQDVVCLPGEMQRPGVFAHACGAATLASAPLYSLKPTASTPIDLGFMLLATVLILLVRLCYLRWTPHRMAYQRLLRALISWVVLWAVVLASLGLAVFERVIWLDLVLLAFAVAVHPRAEDLRLRTLAAFSGPFHSRWEQFVLADETEEPL